MVKDCIMDSGASFHATYCKEELEMFKQCSGKVYLVDDKTLDIASVGDVVLKTSFGFKDQQWKVTKCSLVVGPMNKCRSMYMVEAEAQMKCDTTFRIRRVTRLSKAEILHLWTRFIEPGGSSDTSEGSKNSRRFEDSGRSYEEYSKDGEPSKEEGFKTPHVQRSTRESKDLVRYYPSPNYFLQTENGKPVLFRSFE
nr:hypothetical protein [Tanacetum cinerariifolium]